LGAGFEASSLNEDELANAFYSYRTFCSDLKFTV
jgi:hypothetical protein